MCSQYVLPGRAQDGVWPGGAGKNRHGGAPYSPQGGVDVAVLMRWIVKANIWKINQKQKKNLNVSKQFTA